MLYLILFAITALVIVVIELRAQQRKEIKDRKALIAMMKNKKVRRLPWPSRRNTLIK